MPTGAFSVTVHVSGALVVVAVQFGDVDVRFAVVTAPATEIEIDCAFGEMKAGRRCTADALAPDGTAMVNTACAIAPPGKLLCPPPPPQAAIAATAASAAVVRAA